MFNEFSVIFRITLLCVLRQSEYPLRCIIYSSFKLTFSLIQHNTLVINLSLRVHGSPCCFWSFLGFSNHFSEQTIPCTFAADGYLKIMLRCKNLFHLSKQNINIYLEVKSHFPEKFRLPLLL